MSGFSFMDINYSIGQCLIDARKKMHLSQEQMAEIADLSAQTLSRYENGDRMIKFPQMIILANKLNKSILTFIPKEYMSLPDQLISDVDFKTMSTMSEVDFQTVLRFAEFARRINKYS